MNYPEYTIYQDQYFTADMFSEKELEYRRSLNLQQPFSQYEKALQKIKILYLKKTDKIILDIGAGDGSVFDGTQYIVHGYEPNETACALCSQVFNYYTCNSNLSDFNIRSYELVTILGVLEHVEDPAIFLETFKEAKEIYITVPNAWSFHRHVGKELKAIQDLAELGKADREIGHRRYFSPPQLKAMVAGFAVRNNFRLSLFGTAGFKIGTNEQMAPFSENALHLHTAAENAGLVGVDKHYGAEIFINLVKG